MMKAGSKVSVKTESAVWLAKSATRTDTSRCATGRTENSLLRNTRTPAAITTMAPKAIAAIFSARVLLPVRLGDVPGSVPAQGSSSLRISVALA